MFRGSIVALVTPFAESFQVDYEALRNLARWHVDEGTDAILVCGTTGESPTLTQEEQSKILRTVVETVKGRIPVIVGTGTNDTRVSVCKTKEAQECGADGCLVIVPYYNRPTPEGCIIHFQEVAKVGLPMVVYHHPVRTGTKLSAKTLSEICKIPQVVAVKDSSGDLELALELMRNSSTPLLGGDDVLALPLMAIGGVGICSVIANVIPREWKEFVAATARGEYAAARLLLDRYLPLCRALSLETNPQCIKYAVSQIGKCLPHLRLPLIEPRETTKEQIREAMSAFLCLRQ